MARPRFQFTLRTCFSVLTAMAAFFAIARHLPVGVTILLVVASTIATLWAIYVNRMVLSLIVDARRGHDDLDQ